MASSCDNLATRWSPRAPRWAKIAPKSANMSQHSAIFAPSWRHLGPIFIAFYQVFCNVHFLKQNRSRETLSPILQSHSCSKMATRLPNIVQPSAKMSQDGLQERLGTAKNLHFHCVLRGFCNWSLFCKGRAQDSAKVTKLLPKARQVAHLRTILAPHGPS